MLASCTLIAAITYTYDLLFRANNTTIAVTYLLAILGVATFWGIVEAIAASAAAILWFNYYFLAPVPSLTIDDPQNWIALVAFLITSVVGSQLSASARNKAMEATRGRNELEKVYLFSRSLMGIESLSALAERVPIEIARVFGLSAAAFYDRLDDRVHRAGAGLDIDDDQMRNAARVHRLFRLKALHAVVTPVGIPGFEHTDFSLGSLALPDQAVSSTAVAAIVSLVAAALDRARSQQLAASSELARRNQELKFTLLDALAHDFKTPLTSAKLAISAVLADPSSSARGELLNLIQDDIDRLISMLSDAIRAARIHAGKIAVNAYPHTIHGLLSRTLKNPGIQIDRRRLHVELPDELPAVLADPELTEIVFRQLLDNAIKYSLPGESIGIRACRRESAVVVSVADRGPGIPAQEQSLIFDPTYRGCGVRNRIPGTGMGLTIARKVVESQGGALWVRSSPGQGSVFSFSLPIAAEESW